MGKSKLGMIWDFLKVRKKWWLTPIILFTLLIGLLIVMVEGSAVAPIRLHFILKVSFQKTAVAEKQIWNEKLPYWD